MTKRFFYLIVLLSVSFLTTQCSFSKNSAKDASRVNKGPCKVGLCVVATGRYDTYAEKMIESARTYFCKNQEVTFFVFTDGNIKESKDVVKVYQKRLGWPYDTLKRFHVYEQHKEVFKDMDFLFATDADMLFTAPVGDEILSDRVATTHPGFFKDPKKGSFETNKKSTAFVKKKEKKHYFAGGFYGGKKEEFLRFISTAKNQIDKDLKWDYIAVWHDESHLNRYFIDHPPTLILNPSYCYPESWDLPYEKKLVALDKNHAEMRK